MAVIKKFDSFENKDDIFELIDKFDKSSLFELEISIAYPSVEREVRIKMLKTSSGRNNYWDTHRDIDESDDDDNTDETFDDDLDDNQNEMVIKMSKSKKSSDSKESKSSGGNVIKAPLIGTFYASPSPDSDAYIKVGDKIQKGMILCIIEAMKIMNEIESETDGEITEILVSNGEAVEFGQPLFRVK